MALLGDHVAHQQAISGPWELPWRRRLGRRLAGRSRYPSGGIRRQSWKVFDLGLCRAVIGRVHTCRCPDSVKLTCR